MEGGREGKGGGKGRGRAGRPAIAPRTGNQRSGRQPGVLCLWSLERHFVSTEHFVFEGKQQGIWGNTHSFTW